VKERQELINLGTDHVILRSELKYLIGGTVVMLKCRLFGVKTSPFAIRLVCCIVKHIAIVRFQVEQEREPTPALEPVANSTLAPYTPSKSCHSARNPHGILDHLG
jgi:hypothetical protein